MQRLLSCSLAGFAGAACLLIAVSSARADDWWMLQQTDAGRECGPPIEADGAFLTPEELLKRFPECKLMEETPSLDLETVMLNCEGDIGRVFVFTKSKAACERLAND
jgi:hypothetical protein